MKIGEKVKISIPYKYGEKKEGPKYKEGTILNIYPNFVLVKLEQGYRECYKKEELIFLEV